MGWFSSGGLCMKAFVNDVGLNYNQSVSKCRMMGADIAQPSNELETKSLSLILANYTKSNLTSFWIGEC
jgi:hypothetical protein